MKSPVQYSHPPSVDVIAYLFLFPNALCLILCSLRLRLPHPLSWVTEYFLPCIAEAGIARLKKQCCEKLEQKIEVLAITWVWYKI